MVTRIDSALPDPFPRRPVAAITGPFARFLRIESASGAFLLACAAVAVALVNSPASLWYERFQHLPIELHFGTAVVAHSLQHWINDALMTVFFFVIGMELKREFTAGELSNPKKVLLPAAAALGGAALPAAIYFFLERGEPGQDGWGIPMATDIAFVVGAMALLGSRLPHGLKVMVLTLAIVDDLLAVVVIALFYGAPLQAGWLLAAAGGLGAMMLFNRLGVRAVPVYVLLGAVVWYCTQRSGVHATIAGVFMGLLTPVKPWVKKETLLQVLQRTRARLHRVDEELTAATGQRTHELLEDVEFAAREAVSPCERLEAALHPWVGFVIMPAFAFANAGVPLVASALADSVALSVAIGLVVGKPVGIFVASLLVVRLGFAELPAGVTWKMLFGAGCLAGIGFTMSIFIASLGFGAPDAPQLLISAKSGVLMGSILSGVIGFVLLRLNLPKATTGVSAG